jgi:hypothetical protein
MRYIDSCLPLHQLPPLADRGDVRSTLWYAQVGPTSRSAGLRGGTRLRHLPFVGDPSHLVPALTAALADHKAGGTFTAAFLTLLGLAGLDLTTTTHHV